MASVNPFDLLDDDAEDLNQLVAKKAALVQPAQLPTTPLPPSQAVREGKNAPRGRGGLNRGRGRYNKDSRNGDAPANENGYGGGYRRSEEGDGARRGGPVGGYRGRRGGYNNGDSGDFERPRRNFDRHSGTGHGDEFKRGGAGGGNWGTTEDEIPPVTEESTTAVEKKQDGEEEANKKTPVQEKAEKVPEVKVFTLEEYEKFLEEKRKALQATKIEERKVDTKAFEAMQQLSSKKSNNDEVFIKLGTEKDKRTTEKEEKTKKSLSINEFLKPVNGEKSYYRGGYLRERSERERSERERSEREGRGEGPKEGRGRGEGPKEGRGRGDRLPRGAVGVGEGNQRHEEAPAPKIESAAHFPTLGM